MNTAAFQPGGYGGLVAWPGAKAGADPGLYTPAVAGTGRFHDLSDLTQVLEAGDVAGLSVAFTGSSGAWADAFGVASADGPALTPDSTFQAGSISKAVTAYAAHRLVAEGRLDLDADVNEVLTSWRLPRVRGWQPTVSVRGLLAHVAGVSSGWGEGSVRGEPVPGLLEVLAGTAATPPVVLEALPGLAWAEPWAAAISSSPRSSATSPGWRSMRRWRSGPRPAGMAASTFRQPLPGSLEHAAARGHRGGEPVPDGWRNQPDVGAVGLWTTLLDLVRFAGVVSSDRSVQMLQGHPVEPRMGSGVFLTAGETEPTGGPIAGWLPGTPACSPPPTASRWP